MPVSEAGPFDLFLPDLARDSRHEGRQIHVKALPARRAKYAQPSLPLPIPSPRV